MKPSTVYLLIHFLNCPSPLLFKCFSSFHYRVSRLFSVWFVFSCRIFCYFFTFPFFGSFSSVCQLRVPKGFIIPALHPFFAEWEDPLHCFPRGVNPRHTQYRGKFASSYKLVELVNKELIFGEEGSCWKLIRIFFSLFPISAQNSLSTSSQSNHLSRKTF